MPIQSAFTLNPNEIFASLANMIISQEVFADNLGKHQTLVDKARVDGGLYGDKKLYYATDVLESHVWGPNASDANTLNGGAMAYEASNLLALDRPADPEVQAITLDKFRQIRLTVDNYLSKRAWSDEGSFSSFNSIMLGWMRETKRVYDGTLYNVFIGTNESSVGAQEQTVLSKDEATPEGEAKVIAQKIADILVEMGDYNRDFNDYGYLRSYAEDAIKVIWNSKFVNKIRKVDLPAIFHKEGLVDKFDEEVLPSRYFGTKNAAQVAAASNTGQYRSVLEKDYTVSDVVTHVFPGDKIPAGAIIAAGEGYTEDADIICKIVVKLPPFMSAFEVGTSFFNPRSLTENHYLTFGHNTLVALKNYPFVTLRAAATPAPEEGD